MQLGIQWKKCIEKQMWLWGGGIKSMSFIVVGAGLSTSFWSSLVGYLNRKARDGRLESSSRVEKLSKLAA